MTKLKNDDLQELEASDFKAFNKKQEISVKDEELASLCLS